MANNTSGAQSSPSVRQWPYTSPYYNPMTMRASVLEELNDYLIYGGYQLGFIQLKDSKLTGDLNLQLHDDQSRATFASSIRRQEPDVVIFFMEHIFSHRHTQDGKKGDMRFRISLDKPTWIWLLEEMKIHPKFVESLYFLLGHYATFVTYEEDGKTPESFHLLLKVPPAGHLEAAFYLRHDFKTRKNMVIVAGNDLAGHAKSLIEHLAEIEGISHPFGIVYTVIYRYFYFLEWQRRQLDHAVIMMERVTGRGAVTYSGGVPEDPNPEQFDLQNMHWIGGNQRNVIFAIGFQVKLLTYLQSAHRQFISLSQRKKINNEQMPREDKYLQEAFNSHRVTVQGVLDNCRVIGERAQWQLNAADSIINTMIAKQSQRTADESKNVAVETRRDSTSMKTIASLTMVYLPSTFAATIFSTGFFNVPGSGSTLVVSSAIWKFIIVAAILTGITIGVWVYLNKCGVPRFLSWTQTNSSPQEDKAKRPAPPAKILLDLPQLPGNRANDTESEKSVPIANNDRDEVQGEKANDSTPSVQQRSGTEAKVPERMV